MTQLCSSVDELASLYDVFLVDQFGVLHDGRQAYPGAAAALRQLRADKKEVIIISNSGKRASINQSRLNRLGFDDGCFSAVVTSGEVGWHLLQQAQAKDKNAQNRRCYLLSNDGDQSAIDGLGFTLVSDCSEADLLVLSGLGHSRDTIEGYQQRLKPAISRRVTCYCTNPDKIALTTGGKQFSVGAVAQLYVDMGGEVVWIGKPYAEIYQFIQTKFAIKNKSRVLCVGDSVEHDIAGGYNVGFDTALVRTGILDELDSTAIDKLCEQHGCQATYSLPAFR